MDQITEVPKGNITRRRLLQHGAFLAISALTSRIFNTPTPQVSQTTPEQTKEAEPEAVIETPPPGIITLEDQLFKNFSAEEKEFMEREIAKYRARYIRANDQSRIERVLDWEKSTLQPILNSDVTLENHSFWREFMSGVVYVESEGKALAKSEVGIVGLTQISQVTAQETAKKHGIHNFDLRKGWDSLRLSRFHFQDLMEKYGPDLSLLGYYAGQGFTNQKISANSSKEPNIANLGSTDGIEYFSKVVAASRILEEARTTKS